MDNPETIATLSAQEKDEDKQNKTKAQHVIKTMSSTDPTKNWA